MGAMGRSLGLIRTTKFLFPKTFLDLAPLVSNLSPTNFEMRPNNFLLRPTDFLTELPGLDLKPRFELVDQAWQRLTLPWISRVG